MTPADHKRIAEAYQLFSDGFHRLALAFAAPAERAVAEPYVPRQRQKTPERVALMQRLWNEPGLTKEQILAQLNELPGAPIPMKNLRVYAQIWGATSQPRPTNRVAPAAVPPAPANTPRPVPRPVVSPVAPSAAVTEAVEAIGHGHGQAMAADRATIARWAGERGLYHGDHLDLDRINAKRRQLGMAPFRLERWRVMA